MNKINKVELINKEKLLSMFDDELCNIDAEEIAIENHGDQAKFADIIACELDLNDVYADEAMYNLENDHDDDETFTIDEARELVQEQINNCISSVSMCVAYTIAMKYKREIEILNDEYDLCIEI